MLFLHFNLSMMVKILRQERIETTPSPILGRSTIWISWKTFFFSINATFECWQMLQHRRELICLRGQLWQRANFHFSFMASFYANKMSEKSVENQLKLAVDLGFDEWKNKINILSSTRSICNPHFPIYFTQWTENCWCARLKIEKLASMRGKMLLMNFH